jgi:hypothetical protein
MCTRALGRTSVRVGPAASLDRTGLRRLLLRPVDLDPGISKDGLGVGAGMSKTGCRRLGERPESGKAKRRGGKDDVRRWQRIQPRASCASRSRRGALGACLCLKHLRWQNVRVEDEYCA